MPRPPRDDYERYLTRRRSTSARGSTLSLQDFERLLRRLDHLYMLDLERELSADERSRMRELARILDLEDGGCDDTAESSEPGGSALEEAIEAEIRALEELDSTCADTDFADIEIDALFAEDLIEEEEEVAAGDRHGSHRSRLGSPRPDARNRRSAWLQRRRGSRP